MKSAPGEYLYHRNRQTVWLRPLLLEELLLSIYQQNTESGWAKVKGKILYVPHLMVTTKYMLRHTLLESVMCKYYLSYSFVINLWSQCLAFQARE